jgi:type IV pilus assembly protein PilE
MKNCTSPRVPWFEATRLSSACAFTLIELIIALAIMTILAIVAYPAYIDQLTKGRRGTAEAFLIDLASREQQYLLDARGYAVGETALVALNVAVPTDVASYYNITVAPDTVTSPPSFRLVATPKPGTPQVKDGALELDHTGYRTRAGAQGW